MKEVEYAIAMPSTVSRRRIMLLDDNVDAVAALRTLLESEGHEVLWFSIIRTLRFSPLKVSDLDRHTGHWSSGHGRT